MSEFVVFLVFTFVALIPLHFFLPSGQILMLMTVCVLTACRGFTHRLGVFFSRQGAVSHAVLLNLARGGLPAHVQAVRGGVVHLDVPGWRAWHCRGSQRLKRK